MTASSITCPKCGKTSHHPEDVKHGYCGFCHEFTMGKVSAAEPKATVPGMDPKDLTSAQLAEQITITIPRGVLAILIEDLKHMSDVARSSSDPWFVMRGVAWALCGTLLSEALAKSLVKPERQ